jgi:DNA-dependent RNA polymerase auxiliary subunit epsilon
MGIDPLSIYCSIFEGSAENAAKTPVNVVPTLLPSINGNSLSIVTTSIATKGVRTVRKILEDCSYNIEIIKFFKNKIAYQHAKKTPN